MEWYAFVMLICVYGGHFFLICLKILGVALIGQHISNSDIFCGVGNIFCGHNLGGNVESLEEFFIEMVGASKHPKTCSHYLYSLSLPLMTTESTQENSWLSLTLKLNGYPLSVSGGHL